MATQHAHTSLLLHHSICCALMVWHESQLYCFTAHWMAVYRRAVMWRQRIIIILGLVLVSVSTARCHWYSYDLFPNYVLPIMLFRCLIWIVCMYTLTVSLYFGARVFDIQTVGFTVYWQHSGWQRPQWPAVHEYFMGFCYSEVCRYFNSTPRTCYRYRYSPCITENVVGKWFWNILNLRRSFCCVHIISEKLVLKLYMLSFFLLWLL